MKKTFGFGVGIAVLLAVGTVSTASAQIVDEKFTNSSSLSGASGTTPSSIAGNDFTLLAATTGANGFEMFTPSVDGGKGLKTAGEQGVMSYTNFFTGFTGTNKTFQMAALVRFENSPALASVYHEIMGVGLGDAVIPSIGLAAGTNTTPAPILMVFRLSSGTADSGTTTGITGIPDGEWVGVVLQYEAPSTASGTDGGFHCWLDPATNADAPFFSRGSGVTGGSGVVGLGISGQPANATFVPGYVNYGDSVFLSTTAAQPVTSVDDVALWDGPVAGYTGGDSALLQNAIDYLAAARAAKVDDWNMH